MDKNYELELYKLVMDKEDNFVDELGWISDTEFCVWISYYQLNDFINRATEIFGYGMFDDGGFKANMQSHCACIDLCEMFGDYVDIESVFSKDIYQH